MVPCEGSETGKRPEHVPDRLDEPIYRIFRLERLEEALRLRQLVLVPLEKWEDPFERLPELSCSWDTQTSPWTPVPIASLLKPAFGQCWSQVRESDTLWRAYSSVHLDPQSNRNRYPELEGVQVQSTVRKLRQMLASWAPREAANSWFIDNVRYVPEETIKDHIATCIGQQGKQAFGDPWERAQLLFLKRPAFQHEQEIRLVYVEQRDVPRQDNLPVPFDSNTIFDAITFDPRFATFERLEREEAFRTLGYQGPFNKSALYQRYALDIMPKKALPG